MPVHAVFRSRFPLFLLLALAVAAVAGCKRDNASPETAAPAAKPAAMADTDEHSYAQPDKVVIDDLALDLKLDFDSKTIAGTATYTLEWKDPAATQLVP